jgi:cell division protein FtsQ
MILKKHYFYRDYAQWKVKMFNRNYNYQIDFEISQIWSKSLKIIRLFSKAVLDSSLYKYKKIDLRFTKQVVSINR